ncbi:hypothetical protein C6A36_02680, partial [Desulfobacteraceae bacterium SEEP-SAG10]
TVLVEIFYPLWYKVLMRREDSIIEWLTFIFFFIASIVSFSISITYYKRNQPLFRQSQQKAQVQQNDKYVGDSIGFALERVITIPGIAKIEKEPFFNLF